MALKWQNNTSDSGILRKNDIYENKEDLLVFGYSCKLFRDDEKALLIDQGKHLIPWMGDDSLKIDRYDCRGNLAAKELAAAESRVGAGVSWQHLLSSEELRAERLCDEERYRALHTDEDEEEMYREEELKRLHMAHNASYGQVQFNYDGDSAKKEVTESEEMDGARNEEDEPFVPTPQLNIPEGMPLPETKKLNAIIEKTAAFIASQGTQMEILLKAKQAGNRQFDFLSLECPLHRYYSYVLGAIREGRYRPDQQEKQEEKVEEEEHYLHPSLAPVPVESAPCIPSITYKPSADCAYSMLVNQIKGKAKTDTESIDSTETDIAPPGTETLPLPIPKRTPESECTFSKMDVEQLKKYAAHPFQLAHLNQPDISKAAVMYDKNTITKNNVTNVVVPTVKTAVVEKDKSSFSSGIDSNTNSPKPESVKSTGLKLIHYSDSEEESDSSCSGETHNRSSIVIPPPDLQVIIDKMASYVAKNGDAFENIVKMKGDPRFYFLNSEHQYYGYYKHKRGFYEQTNNKQVASYTSGNTEKNDTNKSDDKNKEDTEQKLKAPVSFSIKKIKEPEPILPKPALPYESSSDEETTKETESADKSNATEELKQQQQPQQQLKTIVDTPLIIVASKLPVSEPVSNSKLLPAPKPLAVSKSVAPPKPVAAPKAVAVPKPVAPPKPVPPPQSSQTIYHIQNEPQASEKVSVSEVTIISSKSHKKSRTSEKSTSEKRYAVMEANESLDKRKKNKQKRSRSRKRSKRDRSEDIITIEEDASPVDPSDFIDLTDDVEDKKDNPDDSDKNKIQTERKKRAAAFLSSLKSLHSVPAHQQSSLASAMVKTLHTYQDGQDIEESKYRRRRRDESSRRKSKKTRRDSREKSFSESEGEMDNTKYEKSERSSRHHSSRKHSKKSKKSSSKDERYPESRSHRDDRKKSRSRYEPSSKEKVSIENNAELKNLEEEFKMCRKHDKLLTSSLKELVKEARKDLISKEPIKMAVDIFSNDSSNEKSPVSSVRNTSQMPEDNWDKGNSELDEDSKESSPDTLSSPNESE